MAKRAHAMQQNAQIFCWDSLRSNNSCSFTAATRPMSLTRPQPQAVKESTGAKKLPGLRSLGEGHLFAGPHSVSRPDLNGFRNLVDEMRADEAQAHTEASIDGCFRREENLQNYSHIQNISEDEALAIAMSLSLSEINELSPEVGAAADQDEQNDSWEVVDMREAGLVPQPNVIENEEDSFVNLVVQRSYAAVLGQASENIESSAVTWYSLYGGASSSSENSKRVANKVANNDELESDSSFYGSVNSLAHEEEDSMLKSASRKRYTVKHRR